MPGSISLRLRTLLGAASAAALAAIAAPPAQAASFTHQLLHAPDQVRAYWTPERMREAEALPLPLSSAAVAPRTARGPAHGRPSGIAPTSAPAFYGFEPGSETAFPQNVHGKIFFTVPGVGDAACSGTIVASRLRNVVFTAGHCINYPGDPASTNIIFVPGYRQGSMPFGEFPVVGVLVPAEWSQAYDASYDVAILQLGAPLEYTLGARGIAFNKPPRTGYRIFGYPGLPAPPYDGQRLIACDAPFFGLELGSPPFSTVAYPCDMEQGSSGGGWVNPRGQVVSVVSHGYAEPARAGQIVGPYFGSAVKRLYNAAGGSAQCPPARKKAARVRKKVSGARKIARRVNTSRAAKRLRTAERKLRRAKSKRDAVC